MPIDHHKSNTIADFTGVVTVYNSQGSTTTANATDMVLPSDWNSVHDITQNFAGNTLGTSQLAGISDLYFAGGSNITLSAQGSTVSILAPSPYTASYFEPLAYGSTTTNQQAQGTVYFQPFFMNEWIDVDRVQFLQQITSQGTTTMSLSASVSAGSASSGTGSWGLFGTALLFSRFNTNETATNFNQLQSFTSQTYSVGLGYSASVSWSTNASSATASWSTSAAISFISNIGTGGGYTTSSSGTTGSSTFSSTSTNANSFSSSYIMSFASQHMSQVRPIHIPLAYEGLAPGEYWIGHVQSTQSGSTNMSFQRVAGAGFQPGLVYYWTNSSGFADIGQSVTQSTTNNRAGIGSYSASSQTTTTIPISQISNMASNASLYFVLNGQTR